MSGHFTDGPNAEVSATPIVATDAFAVAEVGLDRWRRDGWWPVDDPAYFAFQRAIWSAFGETLRELSDPACDLAIADSRFVYDLAQITQAAAVVTACDKQGGTLAMTAASNPLYRPDWSQLANQYRHIPRSGPPVELALRVAAKTVLTGGLRHRDKRSIRCIGSRAKLAREYFSRMDVVCRYSFPDQILAPFADLPPKALDAADTKVLIRFLDTAAEIAHDHFSVTLALPAIREAWLQRLERFGGVYWGLVKRPWREDAISITETARPWNKLIATAARRAGLDAIGFHHGNDMTNSWKLHATAFEYGSLSHFVAPTTQAARLHREEHERCGIADLRPVRFDTAETNRYRHVREAAARVPRRDPPRTIMIVGASMNPNRAPFSPARHFFFQLNAELDSAEILRQAGYEVIYKIHPERRAEVEPLIADIVDRIVVEPFENCWQQADAFVFGYLCTSTFGFALCTNRPIVLLESPGIDWNREAADLLTRRCRLVPCAYDAHNRFAITPDALVGALADTHGEPDMSYVTQLMEPEAVDQAPTRGG